MALWLYEVTFRARRPERPNLKTQTQVSVPATTPSEAEEKARKAATYDGWIVGETMSTVRRFKL